MDNREVTMVEDVIIDAEMWKNLPCELHAHILQFCSVPILCRLRIVCRAWNNQIQKSNFALRVQPQDMYIIKTPYSCLIYHVRVSKDLLRISMALFEPSTQKFYPINIEFSYDGIRHMFNPCNQCAIVAADMGFLWVSWNTQVTQLVVNPVTRSMVEIPPIPSIGTLVFYAMTVDKNYSSFTLYILLTFRASWKPYLAYFDSHVGKWQESSQLQETLIPCHMIKLNETLHTLFWEENKQVYKLFSFERARNAWSDIGIELPEDVHVSQLATALGRLFFVRFVGNLTNKKKVIRIEILEIDIASKKSSIVSKIDNACNKDLLEYFDCPIEILDYRGTMGYITVVGCNNFIVIISIIGKSISYEVLNDAWSEWSLGESLVSPNKWHQAGYGISAMAATLTLNLVPNLQVGQ